MFRKFLKNKKAQNTAEYALLIALVVAGVIAMQTYAQRALNARVRDASQHMADLTSDLGTTNQYEPYYQQSNYAVDRTSRETTFLTKDTSGRDNDNDRGRGQGGFQTSTYNTALGAITGF